MRNILNALFATLLIATPAFAQPVPGPRPAQIAVGEYTPTLSSGSNLDTSSASLAHYYRVGNMVTVFGWLSLDATATGISQITMTLPVASAFANSHELAGAGSSTTGANQPAGFYADTATGKAICFFNAQSTAAQTIRYQFSYKVI